VSKLTGSDDVIVDAVAHLERNDVISKKLKEINQKFEIIFLLDLKYRQSQLFSNVISGLIRTIHQLPVSSIFNIWPIVSPKSSVQKCFKSSVTGSSCN